MKKFFIEYRLVFFFILAFLFSWSLWFISGVLLRHDPNPPIDYSWLIAQIGVFCPSLCALILSCILAPEQQRKNLFILFGIYLPLTILGIIIAEQGLTEVQHLNILSVILVIIAAVGILIFFSPAKRFLFAEQKKAKSGFILTTWIILSILLFPIMFLIGWTFIHLKTGDPSVLMLQGSTSVVIFQVIILICFDFIYGGAVGEEIGWRGFALPILLAKHSPLRASLILGLFWSLWHLPIDLTHGFGVVGVGGVIIRLFWACSMSVIITCFFLHSNRGLLTALLLHGSMNILPALKFSRYEQTMSIMFFIIIVTALLVAISDKQFHKKPISQSENLEL